MTQQEEVSNFFHFYTLQSGSYKFHFCCLSLAEPSCALSIPFTKKTQHENAPVFACLGEGRTEAKAFIFQGSIEWKSSDRGIAVSSNDCLVLVLSLVTIIGKSWEYGLQGQEKRIPIYQRSWHGPIICYPFLKLVSFNIHWG